MVLALLPCQPHAWIPASLKTGWIWALLVLPNELDLGFIFNAVLNLTWFKTK